MIKESLYFILNGRKSIDFKLINVNTSSGLMEESMMGTRSIVEQKVNGNPIPYLTRVEKEPNTLPPLNFCFEEPWNDDLIEEICDWLDLDQYGTLAFSENLNRIFKVIPIESPSMIHNGLKQGYFTITFRCDSPYTYSPIIQPIFDFSKQEENTFEIFNRGRSEIKPYMEIIKIGDGSIQITNSLKPNSPFILKNLKDKEKITIHSKNTIIESSLGIERYADFNNIYLSLPYGKNRFKIQGKCILKFQYEYMYKSLTL